MSSMPDLGPATDFVPATDPAILEAIDAPPPLTPYVNPGYSLRRYGKVRRLCRRADRLWERAQVLYESGDEEYKVVVARAERVERRIRTVQQVAGFPAPDVESLMSTAVQVAVLVKMAQDAVRWRSRRPRRPRA